MTESEEWLAVAESAFSDWDNEEDDDCWAGEVGKVEMHDHALTPEEIASMGAYGIYAERVRALAVAYWPGHVFFTEVGEDDPPPRRKVVTGR